MGYAREWELIRILQDAYLSNDFALIEPYLAPECTYHSHWSLDDAKSKEEVMRQYRKKAKDVMEISSSRLCRLAKTIAPGWQNGPFQNYYPEDEPILVGFDEDDKKVQALVFINLNKEGFIRSISATMPEIYRWEFIEENRFMLDDLYLRAFDFASDKMSREGYLEIYRGRDIMRFPNMVFLKNGLPVEVALRVRAYPFNASLSPSYIERMQESMSLQRERVRIDVQFRNISDPQRPWSMDKTAILGENVTLTPITNELD
jgi:hypothetical protein